MVRASILQEIAERLLAKAERLDRRSGYGSNESFFRKRGKIQGLREMAEELLEEANVLYEQEVQAR